MQIEIYEYAIVIQTHYFSNAYFIESMSSQKGTPLSNLFLHKL